MESERNESVGPLTNDLRVLEVGKFKAERKTSAVTHQYEADMAAKLSVIAKQKQEINELTRQLEDSLNESITLERKIKALAESKESPANLDSIQQDLTQHQSRLVNLLTENVNRSKIEALEDELDQQAKKLAKSESLYDLTKVELDLNLMAIEDMMKKEASNKELIESLLKEQGSIVDLRSKNASLKDELDQQAKKLAESETLYHSTKAELDLNLMAIEDLMKREVSNSELIDSLKKEQESFADLRSKHAELVKKLAESESLYNSTKADLDLNLMAIEDLMMKEANHSKLIESLKKEQGSIVDFHSKNTALKDELNELTKKLAESESLYDSTKAELDLNLMAIEDMSKKEASNSELIESLQKEQESNIVNMGKQMEKLTSLCSQNAALQHELDQLANQKHEIQLIRSEKDRVESKVKSLEAKLLMLEQERLTWQVKLQNAESQLAKLEIDLRKSELKSKDLETKLSQKEGSQTTTPLGKLLLKYLKRRLHSAF